MGSAGPLEIGSSVAHHLDTNSSGSAGFFARHEADSGQLFLVSNAHVLKRDQWEKGGKPNGGPHYTLSPAVGRGGRDPDHRVGEVHDSAPLDIEKLNWIDAAVTALDPPVGKRLGKKLNAFPTPLPPGLTSARITGFNDTPLDMVQFPETGVTPDPALRVHKRGARSGWTSGVVSAAEIDMDVPVRAPAGVLHYKNVIELIGTDTDFASAGDSGAAVVDNTGRLIGLLFAVHELYRPTTGSRVLAYAIPADAIRIYFSYLRLT